MNIVQTCDETTRVGIATRERYWYTIVVVDDRRRAGVLRYYNH